MGKNEKELEQISTTDKLKAFKTLKEAGYKVELNGSGVPTVICQKPEDIDKELKKQTKFDSNNTAAQNKEQTARAAYLTFQSSVASTAFEAIHTATGIFAQLAKEYSRTCKSIATKVVAMGEKRLAQEESYDFGNDDENNADSYMSAVIIK